MKYRSEIDGLRAVAVVPVILFHAGFKVFSGGYVGVDIFFVISGYLITVILLTEIERGEFSIARFYERRARRILPALFLVMAACIPFAWLWMIPEQLRDFGRSVVSVVFFVSNFLFWREEGGYFAAAAELKPLLHTWSLAVEEQYYLFAPLTLAVFWRFGRRLLFWCVAATAVLSLLATEWGWRYAPAANFYLPQFRIWELLVGSLCGFIATSRAPRPNNLLSALGLGMILFAIFRFDRYTPFPSLLALVPVGGAALIVLYGHQGTWVARLLSVPLFVGIGLISYSAYLWHQPLFAFARIRSMGEPSDMLLLALAALSLVLAYFSWRFVEQPFRRRPIPLLPGRRTVFAACSAAGVVFAVMGVYASASGGIPSRLANPELSSREARLLASVRTHTLAVKCRRPGDLATRADLCPIYMPKDPKLRILVVGDSHSYAILPAFAEIGKENAVYHFGVGSCPPINHTSIQRGVFDIGVCEDVTRRQMQAVRDGHYDVVVMVARWSLYPGWDDAGTARSFALSPEGDPYFPSLAASRETFASHVPATVKDYLDLGVAVVVIQQMPEQQVLPQKILQQAALLGIGSGLSDEQFEAAIFETSTPIGVAEKRLAFAKGVLEKLKGDRVWVLSLEEAFKRDGRYIWGDRNGSYYMDRDHISAYGASFLAPAMTAAFADIEDSLRSQQAAGMAPKSRL
ncbi:acyltransferase 3 [Ancylobacter novellus DSM 506]|uniref:Acyltransferase 3 n=1 Tax=Ancylobacter novellus (strain ATCC 8093 / DSM 506 / JCM 20403 / CCM 1077 / IAM 12100 / NBRC 12443 / NCIMB 10456) TaxID=639283 RepID=D7A8V0_ANCN5|nr:acyltransferase family protein [Ancylobacter novellus]ADH90634.1 acyltransferase 3 [Ancylobacter novellus DSM 506]